MRWQVKKRIDELLNKEIRTIPTKHSGAISVLLVHPNRYEIGMSSLGFQSVYKMINDIPDVCCDRMFYPEPEYEKLLEDNAEILYGWETKRPATDFDIIAFSISFELDYISIARILKWCGIPVLSSERNSKAQSQVYPLIVAGGIFSSINPEPLSPLFDAIFIGESEEIWDEFFSIIRSSIDSKEELLLSLSKIDGMYIPSFYDVIYNDNYEVESIKPKRKDIPEKITRRFIENIDRYETASIIIASETHFKDMFLVEVNRGCKHRCGFCVMGYINCPLRHRSFVSLSETIKKGAGYTNRIGYMGTAVSEHPQLEKLCELGISLNCQIGLSSLRSEVVTPKLISLLVESGSKSITLAPEAGTERLRRFIKKGISEDKILSTVEIIANSDITQLKLYFMIGLPTETDDDIAQIVALVKKIKSIFIRNKKKEISVRVSPFVPKLFTPFEKYDVDSKKSLSKKSKFIINSLRKERGIRVIYKGEDNATLQAMFSSGDRRIGIAIADYVYNGNWKQALKKAGIGINTQSKISSDVLPIKN